MTLLAICIALILALAGLLFQCHRRRAAERSLMESNERCKQTESLAREISSRLITAQEDERKRIARDLHDDLNQRLAMLSVELELLGQKVAAGAAHNQVDEIALRVKELSSHVHKLSYELHPAKLDQLGLIAAARTLCRDLSKQSGVEIQFTHNDIRRDIDPTLALSMYRVLQESLHNAVRHSGTPAVCVDLRADDNQIRLVVSDTGRGFDRTQAVRRGLGVISMRERIRHVDGTFALESSRGSGTRVEVCAPMRLAKPDG